jgi:hypothetical protein
MRQRASVGRSSERESTSRTRSSGRGSPWPMRSLSGRGGPSARRSATCCDERARERGVYAGRGRERESSVRHAALLRAWPSEARVRRYVSREGRSRESRPSGRPQPTASSCRPYHRPLPDPMASPTVLGPSQHLLRSSRSAVISDVTPSRLPMRLRRPARADARRRVLLRLGLGGRARRHRVGRSVSSEPRTRLLIYGEANVLIRSC